MDIRCASVQKRWQRAVHVSSLPQNPGPPLCVPADVLGEPNAGGGENLTWPDAPRSSASPSPLVGVLVTRCITLAASLEIVSMPLRTPPSTADITEELFREPNAGESLPGDGGFVRVPSPRPVQGDTLGSDMSTTMRFFPHSLLALQNSYHHASWYYQN